jgi:hypothetical protein
MRVYDLDPNEMEPFEIGAYLFAILAFPEDPERIEAAVTANCSAYLRAYAKMDPVVGRALFNRHPRYFNINDPEARREPRTFQRRLSDRAIAGKMALGFFEEGLTGQRATLPAGMASLSLNELSKLVQPESGISDPDMVGRRMWRKSVPVIHLASAMQVWARYKELDPAVRNVPHRIDDAEANQAIIAIAQIHERIVLGDRRFGKGHTDIIRIRGGKMG